MTIMRRLRIPDGTPEAQYRHAGLLAVQVCLLLTTACTLALSGPLRVGPTDQILLTLLLIQHTGYVLWLRRAPHQFQLIGLLELGGELLAATYRMHQVLLVDHTAHGLSGYSYWLALPYIVASLALPPRAALAVSGGYLLVLVALGAAYWTHPDVPHGLRQDNGNAWLQMLLMHAALLTVITLQQHLRLRYALAVTRAERRSAQALRDPLTGLPGRRALDDWNRAPGRTHSVVYFDLDHFKRVNDTHGHDVGDDVLRHVARAAHATLRTDDRVLRWGGEEFLLLIRGDAGAARAAAERLQTQLRSHRHPVAGAITLSCGVAQLAPHETLHGALRRADEALYAAKRAGRDTVEVAA